MTSAVRKTNAARELDRLGIPYEVRAYEVDLDDLSAIHAAASLGVDVGSVFKTLVVRTEPKGIMMACIPGADELDFKKFSVVTGSKTAALIALKELQPLTGYVRGGCSPLAARKAYPVVVDETAQLYDEICVSAGQRGLQLVLRPEDLLRATGGIFADIVR